MMKLKYLLLRCLLLAFAAKAFAMDCIYGSSISISCPPTPNSNKAFCCEGDLLRTPVCCDANDYIAEHPGAVAGIIIGALFLLALPICCCICCFCACCPIYQRRVQRGAVISVIN